MIRALRKSDDSGMAMVLVVGSMMTLMVLVLGALAYTMQSEKFARYDQDYTRAMAAAQSGVEDYVSRLNRMDTYHTTVDCANTALKGPTSRANSCGWNSSTIPGWLPVTVGDTSANASAFHYSVDASRVNTEGTVMVTSTGRSKGVYRTIEVAVGKGGTTDFVYYTDFESADPANLISYPTGAPNNSCGKSGNSLAKYFWQGRSSCTEITFINSDVLDGRVFSNDAILSSGAQFEQSIESANTGCLAVTASTTTWNKCLRSGSTADFNGKQPKYSTALYLQDNSAEFATYPGCHYYGATRIIFNAAGTMTVWSRDSNFPGAVYAVSSPEGVTPSCGTGSALASSGGATVSVPSDLVIYVAPSPSSERRQLYADEIGGPAGEQLPLGTYAATHAVKPTALGREYTYDLNNGEPTRYKGEGNLYVQGTLKGRVTVAAAQSVIVTGDLVLSDNGTGTDMLGLVATNSVEVMHPRMVTVKSEKSGSSFKWGSGSNEGEAGAGDYSSEGTWPKKIAPGGGIKIAGSIQTLQHSFFVQRYNKGPNKGQLLVTGSIAQRWRGAVGTGSGSSMTGYSKLYQYDQRLKYSAPPYFPSWANSEWSLRYSGEITTGAEIKTG